MTLRIDVRSNAKQTLRQLERLRKEAVPKVMAQALNGTAFDVREALLNEIDRVFDRPKPFTRKALELDKANPHKLTAAVQLKDFAVRGAPASKYLAPQIFGGQRGQKRFERALQWAGILPQGMVAIPGRGAPLDAYGNLKGSEITRMLSQLKASPDPMQNETARSRKRKGGKRGLQYFLFRKGGRPAGIARRRGSSRAYDVIVFFGRPPNYTRRYDFFGVADRTARANWPRQVRKFADRELAKIGP